jgi:dihydrofolate reductase
MRLYIAQSLDGFIASEDGSIDFLNSVPNPNKEDYGYHEFLEGIDVIVMGRKSYEKILSFDIEWPYPHCQTVILSSQQNLELKSPNTRLISHLDVNALDELREASQKGIWLLGGGEAIKSCLAMKALEEMHLAIMPITLGRGIPLFPKGRVSSQWQLKSSRAYDTGVVMLSYELVQ